MPKCTSSMDVLPPESLSPRRTVGLPSVTNTTTSTLAAAASMRASSQLVDPFPDVLLG